MELKNKNVFVTGSTRGIGLAVAHKFASLGTNVVLNGRSEISEDLLAQFADYGVTVVGISGDISNGEDAQRMVAEAIEKLGSIDVLVNNAGITNDKLMLKMTEEDFERVLKINLTGAFNMTQAVLKPMSKARQGAIINMSSVVGLMGNIGQANYAASKAGLIGFTKSVAREVAARGVRVNAIAPGFIESDMTDAIPEKMKDAMLAQVPMKRIGQAEEVAEVAAFLAGQEYLTGQEITPVSNEEKLEIILEHIDLQVKYLGENTGIKEMRKYMSYYLKNLPNATQMRQKINQIETKQELQDCIITYFKNI